MGIVSLIYTDNFKPVVPSPPIIPPKILPVTTKTFFNNDPKDATILVEISTASAGLYMRKENRPNLSSFVSRMNEHFQEYNSEEASLSFVMIMTNGVITLEFTLVSKDGKVAVEFPKDFSDMLGFEQTYFKPGTYKASRILETPSAISTYNSLDEKDVFVINDLSVHEYSLAMIEPQKYTIDGLGNSFKNALLTEKIDGNIFLSDQDTVNLNLEKINDARFVLIKFSKRVNRILGLSENHEFRDFTSNFRCPRELLPIDENTGRNPDTEDDDFTLDRNQLLIISNNANPQRVGSHLIPLLKLVPRQKALKEQVVLDFSPVQYVKVSKQEHNHIHLQLASEDILPINSAERPTTAVFHFRPVCYY
jgi:hypothetical protein